MPRRFAFDADTDGLLDTLTKCQCLALHDIDTGDAMDFADQAGFRPISAGLALLSKADLLVGHNIIGFDLKAIKKVHPSWTYRGLVRDTIVLMRMMWPHFMEADFKRLTWQACEAHRRSLARKLGCRLNILKDEYYTKKAMRCSPTASKAVLRGYYSAVIR